MTEERRGAIRHVAFDAQPWDTFVLVEIVVGLTVDELASDMVPDITPVALKC